MSAGNLVCLWCGQGFRPRTSGGSAQRFCSAKHRHEFGSAARRWAVKLIEAGLISAATLKVAGTSVRAVQRPFMGETNMLAGVIRADGRGTSPEPGAGYFGLAR
jgi:hypothetical protein